MSLRIDRVCTKSGDGGSTGLIGGSRVSKACLRVEAYGQVDELIAVLGVTRALIAQSALTDAGRRELCDALDRVQNELFDLGNELAVAPPDQEDRPGPPAGLAGVAAPAGVRIISAGTIADLEVTLDRWNEGLPALTSFVLPGSGVVTAQIHVARTVCRRVERAVWRLAAQEPVRGELPQYLNRLSDALFVLARLVAHRLGERESLWRRG